MTVQATKEMLRGIQNHPWLQELAEVNVNEDTILDLLGTPDDTWSPGHEEAAQAIVETAAIAVKELLHPLCQRLPQRESATKQASRQCAEGLLQKAPKDWTLQDFNNAATAHDDLS